jgi:peptide/nickel transport system substrate-binding protein
MRFHEIIGRLNPRRLRPSPGGTSHPTHLSRRHLTAVASLAAVCVLATSCTGSAAHGNRNYASNATFTMSVGDDPGTFDPYHSELILDYYHLAYDSLVNLRPDGRFVSGLAQTWTAGTTSATFTLRAGVTCSDGSPLTASQVAADLRYLSHPESQSPLYGLTIPTNPFTVTSDDASRTVKISLSSPFGFPLETFGMTPIMCATGLRDFSKLKSTSAGTGPFVLTNVVPGKSYTFTVREGYTWGPGGASTSAPGTPAKVVMRSIPNETTAANLLISNELNLARITGQDQPRLSARKLAKFDWKVPAAELWFNQLGHRPTAEKRVRQALISALDLDKVVKVSTAGTGSAASGIVETAPKPCPGNTVTGQLPKHDVAAAMALLDQAGWVKDADGTRKKDGKPLSLDLHYEPATLATYQPTAEFIAQQWKSLGVMVKLTADTAGELNQVMFKTSNYDVYIDGFSPTLPSQMALYLAGPVPPKGTNLAGINNAEYNALAAKAAKMTAPASCTYWNEAEKALWHDLDPVPISASNRPSFLQNAQAETNGWDLPIPTSIRVFG